MKKGKGSIFILFYVQRFLFFLFFWSFNFFYFLPKKVNFFQNFFFPSNFLFFWSWSWSKILIRSDHKFYWSWSLQPNEIQMKHFSFPMWRWTDHPSDPNGFQTCSFRNQYRGVQKYVYIFIEVWLSVWDYTGHFLILLHSTPCAPSDSPLIPPLVRLRESSLVPPGAGAVLTFIGAPQ